MKSALILTVLLSWMPFLTGARSADFDWERIHALTIPPLATDGWRSIPWRTDLWEARREAAAKGKPLFLWEMDGHPLGCT